MMRRLAALALLCAAPAAAEDATAGWAAIQSVLQHPRCANCHVGADGIPMWSGPGGAARPHGMHISGGESRIGAEGLPCQTCHGPANGALPHSPPGAPGWALPPPEMAWFGRPPAAICAALKDPARNGGRSLAEVAGHVETDPLVAWGWAPGPGREPAPLSAAELARLIRLWDAAGAPCPAG